MSISAQNPDISGDRQSNQDVRTQNVMARQAVSNIVKPPLDSVRLIKNRDGATILRAMGIEYPAAKKSTITTDGATILRGMGIEYPAAKEVKIRNGPRYGVRSNTQSYKQKYLETQQKLAEANEKIKELDRNLETQQKLAEANKKIKELDRKYEDVAYWSAMMAQLHPNLIPPSRKTQTSSSNLDPNTEPESINRG